jgi:hypothetical protein
MQGGAAANSGYHAANADVGQTEYQMAEATIDALSNMETVTATDRVIVATVTDANSRLARQLEDRSNELKEVKAWVSCLGGVAVILSMMPVTKSVATWTGGKQNG